MRGPTAPVCASVSSSSGRGARALPRAAAPARAAVRGSNGVICAPARRSNGVERAAREAAGATVEAVGRPRPMGLRLMKSAIASWLIVITFGVLGWLGLSVYLGRG